MREMRAATLNGIPYITASSKREGERLQFWENAVIESSTARDPLSSGVNFDTGDLETSQRLGEGKVRNF